MIIFLLIAKLHARASRARLEPPIREILVIKWPYGRQSTPQDNQYEMSNFLAGVGACNLRLTW